TRRAMVQKDSRSIEDRSECRGGELAFEISEPRCVGKKSSTVSGSIAVLFQRIAKSASPPSTCGRNAWTVTANADRKRISRANAFHSAQNGPAVAKAITAGTSPKIPSLIQANFW